jgi:O-antigen/teichoic acid export membrane protein
MLVSVAVACLLRPLRAELLGARRQKVVTRVTIGTGLIEIALILAFGWFMGEYAVPLALGIASLIGIFLFRRHLLGLYLARTPDP